MARKGYDTDLNDAEWALLEPIIKRPGKMGRPVRLDLREIVNALCYWERTGCQWRLIPADFPKWTSVRYYFDKWTQDGTWVRIGSSPLRHGSEILIGRGQFLFEGGDGATVPDDHVNSKSSGRLLSSALRAA